MEPLGVHTEASFRPLPRPRLGEQRVQLQWPVTAGRGREAVSGNNFGCNTLHLVGYLLALVNNEGKVEPPKLFPTGDESRV